MIQVAARVLISLNDCAVARLGRGGISVSDGARDSANDPSRCPGKKRGDARMSKTHDWDRVLGLYARLERNEAIESDTDVRELCRRVARDVAVSHDDAERSLLTPSGTEALVREMRRRIFEGSRRLSQALVDSSAARKRVTWLEHERCWRVCWLLRSCRSTVNRPKPRLIMWKNRRTRMVLGFQKPSP